MAGRVWCQVNKSDVYALLFGSFLWIISGKEVYPGRILIHVGLTHQMSHCYYVFRVAISGVQNERNEDIENAGV